MVLPLDGLNNALQRLYHLANLLESLMLLKNTTIVALSLILKLSNLEIGFLS